MPMRFRTLAICAVVAAMSSTGVLAETPKNALGAIAVSPDDATVLAAGDNRVLYVLDAAEMTVQNSVWIGTNPLTIHYSSGGATIALHDTSGNLFFYDTATWEVIGQGKDAQAIAIADGADILLATGRSKGRDKDAETPLIGYDLVSGKELFKATIKGTVLSIGTSTDGNQIYALTRAENSEDEKKEQPPKGVSGVERAQFEQQHDGKTSELISLDGTGKEIARFTTWYGMTMPVALIATGGTVLAVGYTNANAIFDPAAKSTDIFQTKNSFNYGIGFSTANGILATGGLANGTITDLADISGREFTIDKIGGWPEYFRGFATASDGTTYGGTTAYRVVKISSDGRVLKVAPVY